MKKIKTKGIALVLLTIAVLSASTITADAICVEFPYAFVFDARTSRYLSQTGVTLTRKNSTTLSIEYIAESYITLDTIGIKTLIVYDKTANTNRKYTELYSNDTDLRDTSVNVNGITGHQYYLSATFYAKTYSGSVETIQVTSGTVTL